MIPCLKLKKKRTRRFTGLFLRWNVDPYKLLNSSVTTHVKVPCEETTQFYGPFVRYLFVRG